MSSEEFLERCSRFLSGAELLATRSAVLVSPAEGVPAACLGVSPLLDGYYAWERSFRAALARMRASRLGRSVPATIALSNDEGVASQAKAALQAASPLEGELIIERERWATIESFMTYDKFRFEAVAAYRLHLLALERMARFEAERGEKGYRETYDAILDAANTIDLTGDLR
jgi:hypothetical protein